MKRISVLILVFITSMVNAQDIHFTQFDKSPLMLNPALLGDYDGDYRYSFNQRSQWRSVSRSYNTFGFGMESKREWLIKNLYHGFNYLNDVAGDGDYRTHEFNFTNAYQISISSDTSSFFIPAFQFGFNHKLIDFNAFKYDIQFDGYKYDSSLPNNETYVTDRYYNFNLAVGLLYSKYFSNSSKLDIGIVLFNLIPKTESFFGNQSVLRESRFVFHSSLNHPINSKWNILPSIFIQRQGAYTEVNFGSNFKYLSKSTNGEYIAPYIGCFIRNNDAINVTAGLYYNQWIGGVSYDINISELSPASNIRGGLELSLQYIFSVFKPKNIQYRVCPDYL